MMTNHGQPWYFGVIIGILAGTVIGLMIGILVSKLGIPSFVVTLAFFLALQGVILKLIGQGGAISIDDNVIRGMTIKNVPVTLGWILAILLVVVFAAISLNRHRIQVAKNLAHDPLVLVVIKIIVFAVIILGVTALLNANRSLNPVFPIEGIPWSCRSSRCC